MGVADVPAVAMAVAMPPAMAAAMPTALDMAMVFVAAITMPAMPMALIFVTAVTTVTFTMLPLSAAMAVTVRLRLEVADAHHGEDGKKAQEHTTKPRCRRPAFTSRVVPGDRAGYLWEHHVERKAQETARGECRQVRPDALLRDGTA